MVSGAKPLLYFVLVYSTPRLRNQAGNTDVENIMFDFDRQIH